MNPTILPMPVLDWDKARAAECFHTFSDFQGRFGKLFG